jgi:hypothetical protein
MDQYKYTISGELWFSTTTTKGSMEYYQPQFNHYYWMIYWCSNGMKVSQKGDLSGKLYSLGKPRNLQTPQKECAPACNITPYCSYPLRTTAIQNTSSRGLLI